MADTPKTAEDLFTESIPIYDRLAELDDVGEEADEERAALRLRLKEIQQAEVDLLPPLHETPLETVRRVWPGEWQHLGSKRYHLAAGSLLLPCSATIFGLRQNDWVVQWAGQTIVRGQDLAAVLAEAREVVQTAVADVARAVGLEVVNG